MSTQNEQVIAAIKAEEDAKFLPLFHPLSSAHANAPVRTVCGCSDTRPCEAVSVDDVAFESEHGISVVVPGKLSVVELAFETAPTSALKAHTYMDGTGVSAWLMRSRTTGKLIGRVQLLDGTEVDLRYCHPLNTHVVQMLPPPPTPEKTGETDGETADTFFDEVQEADESAVEAGRSSRQSAASDGNGRATVTVHFYHTTRALEWIIDESGYASAEDVFDGWTVVMSAALQRSGVNMQVEVFCVTMMTDDVVVTDIPGNPSEYGTFLSNFTDWVQNRSNGINDVDEDADYHYITSYHNTTLRFGVATGSAVMNTRWAWGGIRAGTAVFMHELGHAFGLGHNGWQVTVNHFQYGNIMSYMNISQVALMGRAYFTNPNVTVNWDGENVTLGDNSTGPLEAFGFRPRGGDALHLQSQRLYYAGRGTEMNSCGPTTYPQTPEPTVEPAEYPTSKPTEKFTSEPTEDFLGADDGFNYLWLLLLLIPCCCLLFLAALLVVRRRMQHKDVGTQNASDLTNLPAINVDEPVVEERPVQELHDSQQTEVQIDEL